MDHVSCSRLDLSEKFIALSKSKFSAINYYCVDLLSFDLIHYYATHIHHGCLRLW